MGIYPHNISYYEQALLHKSSSVKSGKGRLINNERLEFLGDAILDAVVGDIVYRRFEGKREGFLTNTRSKIVQRETLNRVAVQIGLDRRSRRPPQSAFFSAADGYLKSGGPPERDGRAGPWARPWSNPPSGVSGCVFRSPVPL